MKMSDVKYFVHKTYMEMKHRLRLRFLQDDAKILIFSLKSKDTDSKSVKCTAAHLS